MSTMTPFVAILIIVTVVVLIILISGRRGGRERVVALGVVLRAIRLIVIIAIL